MASHKETEATRANDKAKEIINTTFRVILLLPSVIYVTLFIFLFLTGSDNVGGVMLLGLYALPTSIISLIISLASKRYLYAAISALPVLFLLFIYLIN